MPITNPTGAMAPLGSAGPGAGMSLIVKSDSGPIATQGYARALYCVQAGNIKATGLDGQDFTVAVPVNFILPVACSKVWATGTTVTDVFAIW
jgi:hypothetical protein